jgi:hypothetical protein
MNIHNKQHSQFLSYKYCKILKSCGIPQDDSSSSFGGGQRTYGAAGGGSFYWFNTDMRIYPAEKIIKFPGWEKSYTRALTDTDLNYILRSTKWQITYVNKLFTISIPLSRGVPVERNAPGRGVFSASTEVEAKAMLIKYLISKSLLKF